MVASCSTPDKDSNPAIKNPYLGQSPPGLTPKPFAPGIVTTEKSYSISRVVCALPILLERHEVKVGVTSAPWQAIATQKADFEFTDDEDFGEVESLNDIGKFVTNLVGKIVPKIINMNFDGGTSRPPKIFEIEGNLEASEVDISYVHIKGDLIADDVIIGPDVTINGKILYTTSIMIPDGAEYIIEKMKRNNDNNQFTFIKSEEAIFSEAIISSWLVCLSYSYWISL